MLSTISRAFVYGLKAILFSDNIFYDPMFTQCNGFSPVTPFTLCSPFHKRKENSYCKGTFVIYLAEKVLFMSSYIAVSRELFLLLTSKNFWDHNRYVSLRDLRNQ